MSAIGTLAVEAIDDVDLDVTRSRDGLDRVVDEIEDRALDVIGVDLEQRRHRATRRGEGGETMSRGAVEPPDSTYRPCVGIALFNRAGLVWINGWDSCDITMPFGGFKQSGFGRDRSLHI